MLLLAQAPAPAVPAAPPVTLGTALITAGALLVGIWITNWQQNKREARNFERQLTLYGNQWGDQRDKDAADREEQRRRDHGQWKREDRHRFTEHKREIYADFLGTHFGYSLALRQCRSLIAKEAARREAAGEDEIPSWRTWLRINQKRAYDPIRAGLGHEKVESILLVAPDRVGQKAVHLTRTLLGLEIAIFENRDTAEAEESQLKIVDLSKELRELMRADIDALSRQT